MEVILIKAAQFFLSLSILIVLHELGHFIPAKLFGARVEKFYMFFDWKFSLFKVKFGETEYGIGWLPLGGYVKIAGMIDESMDTDQMKKEPENWEFRSKPAWQRLIILLGGVTVNFILAYVIFIGIMFTWGEKYLPNQNLSDGVWVEDSLALQMGFKTGDKIIDINGNKIERFSQIMPEMIYGGSANVIRENGENVSIEIPNNIAGTLNDKKNKLLFMYRMPFVVGGIPDSSHNAKSGLKSNDIVTAINGEEIKYFDQFSTIADKYRGEQVSLSILRGKEPKIISANISEKGKLGVGISFTNLQDMEKLGYLDLAIHNYSFAEAIPVGINKGNKQIADYLRQLKLIFTPSTGAHKGVGGFMAIANLFPGEWDWEVFWNMTAIISIMLAVLNLLPIPVLDGGHVAFTLWEMISGRKPSDRFLEYAQMIGLILMLALFLYANGLDVERNFFGD